MSAVGMMDGLMGGKSMSTVWYSGTGALSDQEMHELIEIEEIEPVDAFEDQYLVFHFLNAELCEGFYSIFATSALFVWIVGTVSIVAYAPKNYRKRHLELIDSGEFASS